MERSALYQLKEWKEEKPHKPLIIEGARQVGKTWLMKELGRQYYERFIYLNFDNNPELSSLFESGYKIPRLIEAFEILSGVKINPANTLLIFDEIQECPKALTALKYFNEEAPDLDIVAAGSLLGLMHHEGTGFPVGKISFFNLYPMDFFEFVAALGKEKYIDLIHQKDFPMLKIFHNELTTLVKMYCYIGGMPEVVQNFIHYKDYKRVRKVQKNILNAYENDFSKHAQNNIVEKIKMLWRNIGVQLAKENKKFIYNAIKPGARAKEYELALCLLKDAGLVYQVYRVKKPDLPIDAYRDLDAFKLYLLDVGLLSALTNLEAQTLLQQNKIFEEFKGAIAEQYVYQQLKSLDYSMPIYYWMNETGHNEIDFMIQFKGNIIPVEVKAEKNLKAKSLKSFMEKYQPQKAIRTSLADYKLNENQLYDIPLYAIGNIEKIIE